MKDVKQLYEALDKAEGYVARIAVLDDLAFYFLNADRARSEEVIGEMIALSEAHEYKAGLARAYNAQARIFERQREFELAIQEFNKALELARQAEDWYVQAMILDGITIAYSDGGDQEQAIVHAQLAFKLHNKTDDPLGLKINSLNNLGNAYSRMGDDDEAEKYYLQALKIVDEEYNGERGTNVRANMAMLYLRKEKFKEAILEFERCMKVFERIEHKNAIALTHMNIGQAYRELNRFAPAVERYSKAIRMFKDNNNGQALLDAYIGLSKVYLKLGGYNQTLEQLKLCEPMVTKFDKPDRRLVMLELQLTALQELGETEKAAELTKQIAHLSKTTKVERSAI